MAQAAPNTILLAEDEAGLYLQATTCHVWSPTGQIPIVRADPGRAKTNFYITLNLRAGQELAMRSDVMNDEVSAQHLEMILEANPDVPIILCFGIELPGIVASPWTRCWKRILVWRHLLPTGPPRFKSTETRVAIRPYINQPSSLGSTASRIS